MRLPANYVQINAAQEAKLFELLRFTETLVDLPSSISKYEESIDKNTGIIKGINKHWFWVTCEMVAQIMFYKRFTLNKFSFAALETQAAHPVDWIHDFWKKHSTGKDKIRFDLPSEVNLRVLELDNDKMQMILEMFDHCQSVSPIYSTKNIIEFNDLGLIQGTPFHWYQLFMNYIVPCIIYDKGYGCRHHSELEYSKDFGLLNRIIFCNRIFLSKTEPVRTVYSWYKKRLSNTAFDDHSDDKAFTELLESRDKILAKEEKQEKREAEKKEKEKQRKEQERKNKMQAEAEAEQKLKSQK